MHSHGSPLRLPSSPAALTYQWYYAKDGSETEVGPFAIPTASVDPLSCTTQTFTVPIDGVPAPGGGLLSQADASGAYRVAVQGGELASVQQRAWMEGSFTTQFILLRASLRAHSAHVLCCLLQWPFQGAPARSS